MIRTSCIKEFFEMNVQQISNYLGIKESSVQKIMESGFQIRVGVECDHSLYDYSGGIRGSVEISPTIEIGTLGLRYDPITGGTIQAFESVDITKMITLIRLFEKDV